MPSRVAGSDNYLIERQVRGIGRYRISSGTPSVAEYRRRDGIILKLADGGEGGRDTLRLLKQRLVSWGDLIEADERGTLRDMSRHILTFQPLQATFESWLNNHTSHRRGRALAKNTRDRYRESWARFTRVATAMKLLPKENAVLGDLLRVDWARLRANWGASGYDWNNFRRTLSAFLNSALNRGLEKLREEVMRIVPPAESFAKRQDVPITAREFWLALERAPRPLQPAYLTMVLLSTGPDAFKRLTPAHLDDHERVVHVPDDKNEYRTRKLKVDPVFWPSIREAVPCPVNPDTLREHWKKAVTAAGITRRVRLYDLRHLSGQLASKGGASVQDISLHMGHASVQMTMHYLAGMDVEVPGQGIAAVLLKAAPPAVRAMLLPPPAATQSSDSPASGDPEPSA